MGKKTFKIASALVVILFCLVLLLASGLFTVKSVNVSGLVHLQEAYILETAGLNKPVNIFAFSPGQAKKALFKNPYVKTAEIKKNVFSQTVNIKVKERTVSGYVEHASGSYIYIDEEGRVLEVADQFAEKLPVVTGLTYTGFTVGQPLSVPNETSFKTLVTLVHLFNKYEMEASVIKISLQDENNTHLYINNIDVEIGDLRDVDEKIRMVKVILETLEDKNVKGFLDIKDVSKPARFKILT